MYVLCLGDRDDPVPPAAAVPRGLPQQDVRLHGRVLARDTGAKTGLQVGGGRRREGGMLQRLGDLEAK